MITIRPMKEMGRKGIYPVQVFSDGPGTGYLDLSCFQRPGQSNFGLLVQAHGTSVTPSVTLAPVTTALDNASVAPSAVPWQAYSAIADGNLVNLVGVMGCAMRFQFAAAGSVYVAVL